MSVTGVAVCFYVSLAAFVFGGIRAIRASVERKTRDALGIRMRHAASLSR